jgi:hypothetical protein
MFTAKDARANVATYKENLDKSWETKAQAWVDEAVVVIKDASANGQTACRVSCKNVSSEVRMKACRILTDVGYGIVFETGDFYRISW